MPRKFWRSLHQSQSSSNLYAHLPQEERRTQSLAGISRNPYANLPNSQSMSSSRLSALLPSSASSTASAEHKTKSKSVQSFQINDEERKRLFYNQLNTQTEEEIDDVEYSEENATQNSNSKSSTVLMDLDGKKKSATVVDQQNVKEAADLMTQTLLEMNSNDDELNYQILRASLNLHFKNELIQEANVKPDIMQRVKNISYADLSRADFDQVEKSVRKSVSLNDGVSKRKNAFTGIGAMSVVAVIVLAAIGAILFLGEIAVGPPRQPVGEYKLVDLQEGSAFFEAYTFYEGPDSAGSNGYNNYVSRGRAFSSGIASVKAEPKHRNNTIEQENLTEEFVYMESSPTEQGKRESIRLEGKQRFERGLFILDVRHMPSGCGTWPAFWLTDEANWPVNGEIDILEGVNYQTAAKTALHSTKTCIMDDVPEGTKTGTWDTAIGVPDAKTGIPDMTLRYATDCYVYNPHQWLNQGCVSISDDNGSIGEPFNERGGGIYALEWDPVNRHIRSWVFSPHEKIPDNLQISLDTVHLSPEERVNPDPNQWSLPFGYFAIGDSTSCPSSHFKNMRVVFNLAFCGSVAGNRYFMDCPNEFKSFKTCNEYIASNPEALKEAYWKIKGLYIYEREWQKSWL